MAKDHLECISDGINLEAMTDEDLRKLNKQVVALIRERYKKSEQKAASAFRVGDVVSFYSKKYGSRIKIRIERINVKSLGGTEIDGPRRWNVTPSLCMKVEDETKGKNSSRAAALN